MIVAQISYHLWIIYPLKAFEEPFLRLLMTVLPGFLTTFHLRFVLVFWPAAGAAVVSVPVPAPVPAVVAPSAGGSDTTGAAVGITANRQSGSIKLAESEQSVQSAG
ncbi:hypothetical protein AWZ03_010385 [Drosophila navojoa]|uniref:Uncharacterized protein n=1 Tax=Drosophila navojoa TaxID=7232 RepID=A0A484B5S9_DRONA|nr:hypothetical protein AWZ03_010385 [Drosophila navojoa]